MPINPNIILGIQPAQFKLADPLESAQKSLALQHLMGQQDLQGLQVKAAHQLEADDAATRQAFAGGGERSEILKRLMGSGQYKAAQAFEKAGLDTEKARVGIDKDKADILVKATAAHRDQLANVNDPQQAVQWVTAGYQDPYLKDIFARTPIEQAIAKIPQDPEGFQRWKQQNALGATEFIKQNKPHVMAQDTGGSSNIVAVPGLGGAPSVLSSTAKTNTPGELLTDVRTRSEGAANRAITARGQNMTDARSRETLEAGKWQNNLDTGEQVNMRTGESRPITRDGKPVGPKDKDLNDSQSKALLFGTRMAASDKIIADLAQRGTTTSTPGARGGYGVGPTVNALSSADQQSLNQAKRDFINATLRRESGAVISPSEFENAELQYFPQIGDSDQVKAQKAANRNLATQGIMAEVPDRRRPKVLAAAAPTEAPLTATNPATGEKIQLVNGQWLPVKSK